MTHLTGTAEPHNRRPNRLIHEKSPYLLQHAYNPVEWYAWSQEAFDAARREDKPIFLSIGYSTCHWCHVMERESFEDPGVAALMNEAFVCIKLDREERPDIDTVYMKVCQMLTGSGGWPLTIFMTPDRKPFFAATYIPIDDRFGQMGMLNLIPRIRAFWSERRDEIDRSSEAIVEALKNISAVPPDSSVGEAALDAAYEELSARFDSEYGGFGRAPKFPTPHTLLFLLRYARRRHNARALQMVEKTLDALRAGGIYDHVGFGFHRYSTDQQWLVPHFEKMLYDQALLALAHTEAWQATRKPHFAQTTQEILDYVGRVMTDPGGAFYSAEDADSEGEEGKFYLWTEAEIQKLLTDDEARLVIQTFNVRPEGSFEEPGGGMPSGQNIFHLDEAFVAGQSSQRESGIQPPLGVNSVDEWKARWAMARMKLFEARENRVHPHKDDKILADWNGLMIAAFARAAQALDAPEYARAAGRAADFILGRMRSAKGGLLHRYREGEAAVEGHLDDYAFIVWGLIELYEATFDIGRLETALELNARAIQDFWDTENGGFYFTAQNGEPILVRSKELYDGAVPSGNSVQILNLLRLARMTGRSDLEEKATQTARLFGRALSQSPTAHSQFLVALDFALGPSFEVVIAGDPEAEDSKAMLRAIRTPFVPNKVLLLRPENQRGGRIARLAPFTEFQNALEGKAAAYVCQNFHCQRPTTDIAEMLASLSG